MGGKRETSNEYMVWLGKRLGFVKPNDWYKLTAKHFQNNDGHGMLRRYQGSPSAAVMEYLPDFDWKEWLFVQAPKHFWEEACNRQRYMVWLGEQLGFQENEDWYRITSKNFYSYRGRGFLHDCYEGSPSTAVLDYLPDFDWKEWLFVSGAPKNFWANETNRHRFMTWFGQKHDFRTPKDWYSVTKAFFYNNKGRTLLGYYQDSPSAAVMAYIPTYSWKEWLFVQAPKHFWEDPISTRRYMTWLGEKLGFRRPEDWYKISLKNFGQNKGYRFLSFYQNSPSAAVMSYFPEHDWKEWLFSGGVSTGFWDNGDNRRRFMSWLGEQLGFKHLENWYKVKAKDFCKRKGSTLLNYYQDSPSTAVRDYFPEHDWKEWLFVGGVPNGFWKNSTNRPH